MNKLIECKSYRRFGIEIELNTTTDVIKKGDQVPDGAEYVAGIIKQVCKDNVHLNGWLHVNDNTGWVIKPDSTCGIEINSPIMKGGYDLVKLLRVVQLLNENNIKADHRCSFHVHVNLEDLTNLQIASVLAWWIKCEGVLFDLLPAKRKCNRHTQLIGLTDLFEHDQIYHYRNLISALGTVKYYSASVYHLRKERRRSIEFRIAGNEFCKDPIAVKNWIRFLLHFVEVAKEKYPVFDFKDQWSGLSWLDPKDVYQFLKFDSKCLSLGMQQTKQWFLNTLLKNASETNIGIWEPGFRNHAINQIETLHRKEYIENTDDINTQLYSEKYWT